MNAYPILTQDQFTHPHLEGAPSLFAGSNIASLSAEKYDTAYFFVRKRTPK
jgi:hypothetical protein